jgi:hypothetical protein
MKTAAQASANWTASAGRAQTAYVAGVQGTQKDQAALAVAAEARLVQNFNAAVAAGRWRAGITRGGTPYWKTQTEKKAANFGVGFVAGEANFSAAIAKVMTAIATGVANLPPRGDINANLQRVTSLDLYLHSLKGQLGAR